MKLPIYDAYINLHIRYVCTKEGRNWREQLVLRYKREIIEDLLMLKWPVNNLFKLKVLLNLFSFGSDRRLRLLLNDCVEILP